MVESFNSGTGFVTLYLPSPERPTLALGSINENGSFRLCAREPGRYWLEVTFGPNHHQMETYVDCIEVPVGSMQWNLDWREGVQYDGVQALAEFCD